MFNGFLFIAQSVYALYRRCGNVLLIRLLITPLLTLGSALVAVFIDLQKRNSFPGPLRTSGLSWSLNCAHLSEGVSCFYVHLVDYRHQFTRKHTDSFYVLSVYPALPLEILNSFESQRIIINSGVPIPGCCTGSLTSP